MRKASRHDFKERSTLSNVFQRHFAKLGGFTARARAPAPVIPAESKTLATSSLACRSHLARALTSSSHCGNQSSMQRPNRNSPSKMWCHPGDAIATGKRNCCCRASLGTLPLMACRKGINVSPKSLTKNSPPRSVVMDRTLPKKTRRRLYSGPTTNVIIHNRAHAFPCTVLKAAPKFTSGRRCLL